MTHHHPNSQYVPRLAARSRYAVHGSLVDFGTGSDRNSNTSFYVEVGIDESNHTLTRDGWKFRIVRWDNGNENTVQVHDPFGNRLIDHYLGSAPTEPMVVPFEFHRDGDDVTLVVHAGEERLEATGSLPLDTDARHVMLRHTIFGFDADSTQFGWANLQVFDLNETSSAFDMWRARHFSAEELDDPEISGEHASPAGDGMPNLLKYALGLDPRRPAAPEERPTVSLYDESLALLYRPDADAADVALVPEVSDNLLDWESGDAFVEVTEESVDGATLVRARSVESITDRSSLFIRLRAEREP